MDGVLVIDKPSGPTSHDVVARMRRVLGVRRIGHTGTLDPLASGVLPLVVGRATRLASLLSASEKEYLADVRLGAATATYDAAPRLQTGEAAPPAPAVTDAEVEAALASFRGTFLQIPPPYSAKKIGGVPAYTLARRDRPMKLAPVSVNVRELECLGLEDGLLGLRIVATAGFYVRSLAHDLGRALGCGAYLEALRRTRAGQFTLREAAPLEQLEAAPETAAARLLPMSALAHELPGVTLTVGGAKRASHGNALSPSDLAVPPAAGFSPGSRIRLLTVEGALVAIAIAGPDGLLRPSVVLV